MSQYSSKKSKSYFGIIFALEWDVSIRGYDGMCYHCDKSRVGISENGFIIQGIVTDISIMNIHQYSIFLIMLQYWKMCLAFRGTVDTDSSNETVSCQSSVDLPAVGAAEQEHLSSLSIFLILCVLGKITSSYCIHLVLGY